MIARFDQQPCSCHHVRDCAKMIMGRAVQIFAIGLVMLECIGCSSIVVPAPVPQNAHIGITLSSPIGFRFSPYDHPFTVIYFARLEEDQDSFVSKFPLVPSNAKSGNRFYLLNAPPGRYVAVAGFAFPAKDRRSSGIPGSSNFDVGSAGTPGYYVAF